jgi:hypothetical protein
MDRFKLYKTRTTAELESMIEQIRQEPSNLNPKGGIYIYTKKAMKQMDDISWAITWQIGDLKNQSI